jgi:multidrug resistance efflux pump
MMMMMAASMILVVGWIVSLVQSKSTVAVSNSVINGNYLPVNSPHQGQLTEMLVKPGAEVRQGDVLARLSNEDAETNLALVRSKLMRVRADAKAYREEAVKVKAMFVFTQGKVQRDLKVAEATLAGSQAQLQAAQSQLSRLQPLIDRGNVAMAEVDEAKAILASANAEQMRQSAIIATLEFVQEAAKQNIMLSETGALDPLSSVSTKIALADAAVEELAQTEVVLKKLALPIEMHSPSDGTIYAIYRGEGETLQVADQILAVSANDGGWATGHVAADMAPEIRPGHPVEVDIPSLGINTTGIVEAIGHRAVYGRGGYNADFHAGPLEVPIRVAIDLKGQAVPSGLRLHMTVRLRDHLKEIKSWVNEKIATHWYKQPPASDSDDPVDASPAETSPTNSGSIDEVQVAVSR